MPLHSGPMHPAVAVYVFDPSFSRLLFIRHRKPPLAGQWLPPGGHVEADEAPDQAALREVLEETGQEVVLLDLTPPSCRGGSERVRRLPGPLVVQIEDLDSHRHLDFVFVAVAPRPTELRWEDPEQPVAWLGLDDLGRHPVLPDCLVHARHLLEQAAWHQAWWQQQQGAQEA